MMEQPRQVPKTCFQEVRNRNINSPSILLIFYSIPTTMTVSIGQGIILSLFTDCDSIHVKKQPFLAHLLQNALIFSLHPLIGWLADTKLGRNKTISLGLWLSWIGTAIQIISLCLHYDTCKPKWLFNIATYVLSLGALVFIIVGIACYQSTVLAYGLDQLPDASTVQVRKFIHWLTWGFFVGLFFNYLNVTHAIGIFNSNLVLGTSFATFVLLSVAVILHTFFKHKFHFSATVKRNPYAIVMKVIKHVWKHGKTPAGHRSALTYWEGKIPSRIDFCKTKYGGPFPECDVEDSKTFCRIVTIFLSIGGLFIPYSTVIAQGAYYGFQFHGANDILNGYGAYILWQMFYQIGIITIPITDLIILPLFPKIEYFSMNSLKGLTVATGTLACGLASMLVIEGIAVARTDTEIPCYLSMQDSGSDTPSHLNLSYYFFLIPWFFIGISAYFTILKAFEFISSQAPYEMSGMLTGVFWLTRATYISIGAPLVLLNITYHQLPCTFWILFVQLIICIPFWIVFIILAMHYQKRSRELEYPIQRVTEQHYSLFLHSSYNNTANNNHFFNRYDLPINGWSDDVLPI